MAYKSFGQTAKALQGTCLSMAIEARSLAVMGPSRLRQIDDAALLWLSIFTPDRGEVWF